LISYMAELTGRGTHIVNLRHFPLTESSDGVADWTPDSKEVILASDRAGKFGIYKQALNGETAEPLVIEGYGRNPRVTPDGRWILYLGAGENGEASWTTPAPVMRVPTSGGRSQQLFAARPMSIIDCARSQSGPCVIAEPTEDHRKLIVSSIDPLQGRGPELSTFALDPNTDGWYALSSDGTRIAATRNHAGPIYVLSLQGQKIQQINVKGWINLLEFTWAADRKGLYVISGTRTEHVLLYVDLQGNAHPLWKNTGASNETLALPSPDGHHLAIQSWVTSGNMWMMENF
jgi:Tol biopolymer transport system component